MPKVYDQNNQLVANFPYKENGRIKAIAVAKKINGKVQFQTDGKKYKFKNTKRNKLNWIH